jgi:hypothetical protein
MINNGGSNANRKVLVKRAGENPLPSAQPLWLRRLGPPIAAPRPRNSHIDLFRHLSPCQALVPQLHDLLRRGWVSRSAATHDDASATKLVVHCGPSNAQLRADLAQAPALGVQLFSTLNVHSATRNELRQSSAFVVEAYGLRRCPWLLGEPAKPSIQRVHRRLTCGIEASDDGRLARSIALHDCPVAVEGKPLSRVTVEVA